MASPWLVCRYIAGKSRRGWRQKLLGIRESDLTDSFRAARADQPVIWLHAVSVGEINLLQAIIDSIRGDYAILITTSTETGFDLATKKFSSHPVCFLPFDFSWAMRASMRTIRPAAIILAELEIWPNLVSVACEQSIGVGVINARLGEKSFAGYQRFSRFLRPTFSSLDLVATQTEAYAERFVQLGCPASRVHVTGSLKFDNAVSNRQNDQTEDLVRLAGLQPDDVVLVAGSTQLEEDLIVIEVLAQLYDEFENLKVVLVPRHPDRCPALLRELDKRNLSYAVRSEMDSITNRRLIVVDVIGELAGWWGRADMGYVGGSMGAREGQNMIEPAALGVPVCFGPRTKNFKDAVEQLLAADAARVVHNQTDLTQFVRQRFENGEAMIRLGQRASSVVDQNLGATESSIQLIRKLIDR